MDSIYEERYKEQIQRCLYKLVLIMEVSEWYNCSNKIMSAIHISDIYIWLSLKIKILS